MNVNENENENMKSAHIRIHEKWLAIFECEFKDINTVQI